MPNTNDLDELVIIEDDDAIEEDIFIENEPVLKDEEKDNTTKYIIIAIIVTLLVLSALGIYFVQNNNLEEVEPETNSSVILKKIKSKEIITQPTTRIQKLTKKAKKLYSQGKKEQALKIYEQISAFHKYLSIFNLASTSFKEKDYNKSIEYFKKSATFKELRFESNFNIAVCYKMLHNNINFKKYLNIADNYVIDKYDTDLFDYYYGLIYHYKNKPIESMMILRNYKANYFSHDKNLLLAKQYTLIKNYSLAINHLLKLKDPNYDFTVAELYAKVKKYDLAQQYFLSSIKVNKYPIKSLVALSLVQNKLGMFENCSSTLKKIKVKYPDAQKLFPIKVKLKESLYDPILAQKEFQHSVFSDKFNKFSFVFYFAPYKLFDPKQSNSIIKKGVKEVYIDNFKSATSYLNIASTISDINLQLVEGLKLIQKHKIYEANKLFKKLIKKYPNHSVLHYDLALTYANISDFQKAKKHFDKSYLLDKTNHLSAFFSAYSALLTNQTYDEQSITNLVKHAQSNKYEILLLNKILKDDPSINFQYANNNNSFDLALGIVMANISNNYTYYKNFTNKLYTLLPKDLVTNIIYVDEISQDSTIKTYAQNIQKYLVTKSLNKSPLLYGGTFARELYIRVLSIAGVSRFAKELLENELPTNQNQIALLQSLAYTYIFTKEYEKAYKIYNNLIDNKKVTDPHTLLLASIASVGANHHANAIALLELANLDNKSLYESRYALGILYQEAKNFEGASIQFKKIGNSGFKPKYFDFDLNR